MKTGGFRRADIFDLLIVGGGGGVETLRRLKK